LALEEQLRRANDSISKAENHLTSLQQACDERIKKLEKDLKQSEDQAKKAWDARE
jgi:TPP-dependent pyruvate/acetoin dehydrogenase alpha subunit